MRWFFIALSVCGLFYLQSLVAPHFWANKYVLPGIHVAVTYGLMATIFVIGLGIAKLKFGK